MLWVSFKYIRTLGESCWHDKVRRVRDVSNACSAANLSTELKRNCICTGHKLTEFPPLEYEEDYNSFQKAEDRKCSEIASTIESSELVPLENFNANRLVQKVVRRN